MSDQMRAEFEVWAVSRMMVMRTDGDTYYHHETSNAWDVWQASRAALVVELPAEDERGHIRYTAAMRAIQSSGVSVK
jgi:hypothetical protein